VWLALAGAGCGSTTHGVDYGNIIADVHATGSNKVAVATLDQRPPVGKAEQPTWAGDSPFGRVHTASGRPLDAISNAVPAAARKVLEALLNDGKILAALNMPPREDSPWSSARGKGSP